MQTNKQHLPRPSVQAEQKIETQVEKIVRVIQTREAK